ncbi:MFS transporter [Streptomyces sp. VRA16 Mangrove soil]|uniref:MFS transporter n=1 Tax=Streptomyces sp. VRA16 Mangrove soil TaxID=2817434 RepID=UPI001A9D57EA|nr:MFS transporter [Streptomyces sp. VRA16 Mangrove soil]MBO1329825.1 MFS transporter [Streptomyces sp. VRA16 Mangrove soil]
MTALTPDPTHGDTPSRARAWSMTVFVFLFLFLAFANKAALGLVADPLSHDLGLSYAEFGLIVGSSYFLFAAGTLAAGLASTRIPVRRLLLVCATAWAVTQAPMTLPLGIGGLMACRMLLGASLGPGPALAGGLTYSWFPPQGRAFPGGIVMAGTSLGVAVSSPVLAWATVAHGWRAVFTLLSLASAGWALLWLIVGREGPFSVAVDAAAHDRRGAKPDYRAMFRSRTWIACVLGLFGATWTAAVVTNWLPTLISRVLHVKGTAMGFVNGAAWTTDLICTLAFCYLADRGCRAGRSVRATRSLPGGLLLLGSAVSMLALPLLGDGYLALGVVVLGFPLYGVFIPFGLATIAEVAPVRQRAAALLTGFGLGQLSTLVGPWLVGVLLDAAPNSNTGLNAAFALTGALLLVGAAAMLFLARPERGIWAGSRQ